MSNAHDARDGRATEALERYADVLDGGHADANLVRTVATLDALCARIPTASVAAPHLLDAELHAGPAGAVSVPLDDDLVLDGVAATPTPTARPLPLSARAALRPTRRAISGLAATAAVLAVALLAYALFARLHAVPGAPGAGSQVELESISMVSPDEGWAVGGQTWIGDQHGAAGIAVLYHYTDGRWTPTYIPISDPAYPDTAYPVIRSISMLSASDGWAVGATTYGSVSAFFLHFDGRTWHLVRPAVELSEQRYLAPGAPRLPGFFDVSGLRMLASDDGWAVTGTHSPDGGWALYHFDGRNWTSQIISDPVCWQVSVPTGQAPSYGCSFTGLAMQSAGDGWVVGTAELPGGVTTTLGNGTRLTRGNFAGVIFHDVAGIWHLEATFPNVALQSVTMESSTTGWAVGQTLDPAHLDDPNAGQRPVLVRYTGGAWRRVASPLDTFPLHASYIGTLALGHNDTGWLALSSYDTGAVMAQGHDAALLRLMGDHWQTVPLPLLPGRIAYHLNGLASAADGEAWVVGTAWWPYAHGVPDTQAIGLDTTATPLVLHYADGAWSAVLS